MVLPEVFLLHKPFLHTVETDCRKIDNGYAFHHCRPASNSSSRTTHPSCHHVGYQLIEKPWLSSMTSEKILLPCYLTFLSPESKRRVHNAVLTNSFIHVYKVNRDETLLCDHSSKNNWAVFQSCGICRLQNSRIFFGDRERCWNKSSRVSVKMLRENGRRFFSRITAFGASRRTKSEKNCFTSVLSVRKGLFNI